MPTPAPASSAAPSVAQVLNTAYRAENRTLRAQRLVLSLSHRARNLEMTIKRLARRNKHLETEVRNLIQRIRELESQLGSQNHGNGTIRSKAASTADTIDEILDRVASELRHSLLLSTTATEHDGDSQGITDTEPKTKDRRHSNAMCDDESMGEGESSATA